MPLISICNVDVPKTAGSASEPPLLRRSSSSLRSAARAARPTSSGRRFRPSSSSITVSGMTRSTSLNESMQPGSAMSTDVSSTIRVRSPVVSLGARGGGGDDHLEQLVGHITPRAGGICRSDNEIQL
ncbi:MAG: hypothetical protein WKF58_17420 [Ilumatobacteraceae bacterium]